MHQRWRASCLDSLQTDMAAGLVQPDCHCQGGNQIKHVSVWLCIYTVRFLGKRGRNKKERRKKKKKGGGGFHNLCTVVAPRPVPVGWDHFVAVKLIYKRRAMLPAMERVIGAGRTQLDDAGDKCQLPYLDAQLGREAAEAVECGRGPDRRRRRSRRDLWERSRDRRERGQLGRVVVGVVVVVHVGGFATGVLDAASLEGRHEAASSFIPRQVQYIHIYQQGLQKFCRLKKKGALLPCPEAASRLHLAYKLGRSKRCLFGLGLLGNPGVGIGLRAGNTGVYVRVVVSRRRQDAPPTSAPRNPVRFVSTQRISKL